jgi:hypothetical protein
MAIIYTYPQKAALANDDLVLISDSADGNKTKQVKASALPGFSGTGIENLGVGGSLQSGATQTLASGTSFIDIGSAGNTHTWNISGALPIANGGTALTAVGTKNQILRVNSAANALEYADPTITEVVKNSSGTETLAKGTPVYIDGVSGTTPTVAAADADSSSTMPVVGLLTEELAPNASGVMMIMGVLEGLDTAGINGTGSAGAIVYVSNNPATTNGLTYTKPQGTQLIQNIGIVVKYNSGTSGSIQVSAIGRTNDLPNIAQGNIWIGDANGVPSSLAIGANATVLTSNGTTATWATPATGVDSITFGTTGLTPNSATTGAVTVSGTLRKGSGGTGQNTYSTGDLLYNNVTANSLDKLAIGTSGQVLRVSSGGLPEWASVAGTGTVTSVDVSGGTTGLTTSGGPITTSGTVTIGGTLAYTNGGTGLTSLGSKTQVLKVTGAGPAWIDRDGPVKTLTSAASVAWNYQDGSTAFLLLGAGNADVLTINNLPDGGQGIIIIDGTANQTFALPTSGVTSKITGGTYTPSAGIDVLRFVYRSLNNTIYWWKDANLVTYTP